MTQPQKPAISQKALMFISKWAILLSLPLMLSIRLESLVAPNEEPKWFLFALLGIILAITGSWSFFGLPKKPQSDRSTHGFSLSLPAVFFLLFFVGLALGTLYALNPEESLNRLAFWSCYGILFYFTAWHTRHTPKFTHQLQISLTIGSLLLTSWFWYAYFFQFNLQTFNKFVQFSRIGHFNFTADVLMTLLPLLAWILITADRLSLRIFAAFSFISGCFMLLASGSLGGMGGFLGGGLFVGCLTLISFFSGRPTGKESLPPKKSVILFTLIAVCLLAAVAKPVFEHLPKDFREQIFTRAEWWGAPQAEAIGKATSLPPLTPLWLSIMPYLGARTPMWASTAGMIAEHPWRGFGTGSYLVEYSNFNKRYDLFVDPEIQGHRIKTNPHNVFLQIAADNGIPMAVLFGGLYLWLTLKVLKEALKAPSPLWLCGLWGLIAAFLDAEVNHVFFNPASLFMAAIAFGLLYGQLPLSGEKTIGSISTRWQHPITASVLTCFALLILIHPLRWVVSEYYFSKADAMESSNPPASGRQIKLTLEKSLAWSPNNIRALYGLALMEANMGQIEQSMGTLHRFLSLAPYHTASLNLLAYHHLRLNQPDEAKTLFKEAQRIDPDDQISKENLAALEKRSEQPAPIESKP